MRTFPQVTITQDGTSNTMGCEATINRLRPTIDFEALQNCVRAVTYNLNTIIDRNYYPTPQTEKSNLRHRPIGIGVQGLADLYQKLWVPFDSQLARDINKEIFECIYFAAMSESVEIAKNTQPYDSYEGSPLSQGKFQFDLWMESNSESNQSTQEILSQPYTSDRYDWVGLRRKLAMHGAANSLLVAIMPTASTSQILGNNECTEPYTSNIYTRRTLAGEFMVINKMLLSLLEGIDLWKDNKDAIIADRGSIQNLGIPKTIKDVFKCVWEIKQKAIVDLAADRGPFVCQSQSMNLFFEKPTQTLLNKAHFYGWKRGLKTGSYYIRSKPAANAKSVTVVAPGPPQCEMCSG